MSSVQRLLGYFAPHRRSLFTGLLCLLLSAFFSLLKPLIVGSAVDVVTTGVTRAALIRFGLLYVGASAIQGLFLFLQRYFIIGTSRRIEFDLRRDFYQHLQTLPRRFFAKNRTGDLMSRATNDLSAVRMLVGPALMHAATSVIVIIGAFAMMFRIDRVLALTALVGVPFVAIAAKVFGEMIHHRTRSVQDFFGELSAKVQENLAGARVVRAFVQEENQIRTFAGVNREYVDRSRKLIQITATFRPVLELIIGLSFILVFVVGTRKIVGGTLTLGSYVAFQFYMMRMIWPLIAVGWVINLFQRGLASMDRLVEVWNTQGLPESDNVLVDIPETDIAIEVRDLEFGYGEDAKALRGISFRVATGSTLGIVGKTGSGKSTILELIAGVWDAPPGAIFIHGRPVESIPKRTLRELIAKVPQETFLFSDTLAENIRFGDSEAGVESIAEVIELAGLEGDLSELPNGVETVIGERGITLSGGQKQRTAIARALVRDPRVLIFDDALSAVDTETEDRILHSIRRVRKGRTALIVTHRVSSVRDADQIIVLEDGLISERGTHTELIANDGFYAELYRRQTLESEIEEIA